MLFGKEKSSFFLGSAPDTGLRCCGNSELPLVDSADSPFVADGELPTAPRAAAGQYGTAIDGLHALAEAVFLRALAVIRLKRSLRHGLLVLPGIWVMLLDHGVKQGTPLRQSITSKPKYIEFGRRPSNWSLVSYKMSSNSKFALTAWDTARAGNERSIGL